MRVLIIKLTSMGDLMHALPALTDAVNAIPDIEFQLETNPLCGRQMNDKSY